MINKCLVDTDVLIAAYTNSDLKKKESARNLILKLYNEHKACTSIQNLLEFATITRDKLKIADKHKLECDLSNMKDMFEIIHYNQSTIADALSLSFEKNITFNSALLLQTMLDNKVATIYTFDEKNIKKIKGIKVINLKK
jgi:predicted nucleic acid-binding protein